jgi:hypothetical protein
VQKPIYLLQFTMRFGALPPVKENTGPTSRIPTQSRRRRVLAMAIKDRSSRSALQERRNRRLLGDGLVFR